jgi:hypothetical protein
MGAGETPAQQPVSHPCEHKSLAGDPGLETGATVLTWGGGRSRPGFSDLGILEPQPAGCPIHERSLIAGCSILSRFWRKGMKPQPPIRRDKGSQPHRRWFADNYPPSAHNKSMNKDQSRDALLLPIPWSLPPPLPHFCRNPSKRKGLGQKHPLRPAETKNLPPLPPASIEPPTSLS